MTMAIHQWRGLSNILPMPSRPQLHTFVRFKILLHKVEKLKIPGRVAYSEKLSQKPQRINRQGHCSLL